MQTAYRKSESVPAFQKSLSLIKETLIKWIYIPAGKFLRQAGK